MNEPVIVTKVRTFNARRGLEHINANFIPISEFNEEKSNDYPQITQNFHGDVEKVAGRDINEIHLNATTLLIALQNALEKSDEIPPEKKKSIKDSIQEIIMNPYVANISSSLIMESLKSFL